MRRWLAGLVALTMIAGAPQALAQTPYRDRVAGEFRTWLSARVWPDAARQGVSQATFQRALAGVTLDWSLPDLAPPGAPARPGAQRQAEFRSPAAYFSEDQLAGLARSGRALVREWSRTLDAVERRYGVPREIVVAIWGRESAFGRAALPHSGVRALATKAFMATRRDFFYAELVAALRILEEGHVAPDALKSSWAGALGQPQFLPTSFLKYAVDFDGDGRRDIWNSVPDTLGSIANYLAAHGWKADRGWGVEASVPDAVPCTLEGPDQGRPPADWQQGGVRTTSGGALQGFGRGGRGHLLMPAGRLGPAFMVTDNFYVLKAYNESDLYALFVGHVADRIRGDARISGRWATMAGFSRGDVRAMQERLVAMGHDVGGADGLVGFRTRVAIGRWQAANGIAPTCFPDAGLIRRIRS